MKIRCGFVSNSSAASFCIYGWKEEQLKTYNFNIRPDPDTYYPDFSVLKEEIIKICPELEDMFVSANTSEGEYIIGIGRSGTEVDHYLEDGQDWEYFRFPEPSITDGKKLDKVAKILGLPEPKMHSETWFDG